MSAQAAAVATAPERPGAPTSALSGAWLLSVATVGSGVLAYAFHVLAARTLGPTEYGLIAVLWGAMFLAVVVLFRPLEQTISRAVAERLARAEDAAHVLRSVIAIYLGIVVVLAVVSAVAWPVLTDSLFDGSDACTASLVLGTCAYGVAYLLRGLLSGGGWYDGYGWLLIGDAGVRLLAAVPLVAVASTEVAAAALALAAFGGAVLPLVVDPRRVRRIAHHPGPRTPFHPARAFAFAAPAGGTAAADQILVNSAPVLVMLEGGSAETAAVVFAATMLVRVPVYLFTGFAASLLPNLTRMQAADDLAPFGRALVRASGILALLGLAIVAAAAIAGPFGLELLYGDGFEAGRTELTLLGAGAALYILAATLTQASLALDRVGGATAGWIVSAAMFLALWFALPGDPLTRIAVALAAALALLCGWLAVQLAVVLRSRTSAGGGDRLPT